jgi:hypothetical protein
LGKSQEKSGNKKQQPLPTRSRYRHGNNNRCTAKTEFRVYQFCEITTDNSYRCLEEGIFYADELRSDQQHVLRTHVREQNNKTAKNELKLKLHERRVFVEKVMYTAIQAGAGIVAFNLRFDPSRLALEYRVARGAGGRGWSFVVFRYKNKARGEWLPNSFRPRIQLRPKDSKAAFIRLAGGYMNQPYRVGAPRLRSPHPDNKRDTDARTS